MRKSSLLAVLLVSVCFLSCTIWKEKKVTAWSNVTGGEKLEHLLWQEIKAKNAKELHQRMAATFVYLTPSGPLSRAATLEHLAKLDISDYSLGDFHVQPNGMDMVITYTVAVRGSFAGQPLPTIPVRMMTVWQQVKNDWIAIAHAETHPGTALWAMGK